MTWGRYNSWVVLVGRVPGPYRGARVDPSKSISQPSSSSSSQGILGTSQRISHFQNRQAAVWTFNHLDTIFPRCGSMDHKYKERKKERKQWMRWETNPNSVGHDLSGRLSRWLLLTHRFPIHPPSIDPLGSVQSQTRMDRSSAVEGGWSSLRTRTPREETRPWSRSVWTSRPRLAGVIYHYGHVSIYVSEYHTHYTPTVPICTSIFTSFINHSGSIESWRARVKSVSASPWAPHPSSHPTSGSARSVQRSASFSSVDADPRDYVNIHSQIGRL